MIFGMDAWEGRTELPHRQLMECPMCGKYDGVRVYFESMDLHFMRIKVKKFQKKYFCQMGCCGNVYQLPDELGKRLEQGEYVEIQEDDLIGEKRYHSQGGIKRCSNCGFEVPSEYQFCPNCGMKFY